MLDRAESALKEPVEREHALPRVSSHGRRRAESARRSRRGSPRWTSRAVIPVDGVASLSDLRPGQDVPTASCARVCASTGHTRSMTCTVALGGECEGPGVVTRPLRLDRCSNPCGGTYHLACSLVHGDYSAARSSTAVDSNVVIPVRRQTRSIGAPPCLGRQAGRFSLPRYAITWSGHVQACVQVWPSRNRGVFPAVDHDRSRT